MKKANILFLCTGNSCRSQMAEAWCKKLKPNSINAYSAGTNPQGINPYARKVLEKEGVSLDNHSSKHIDELSQVNFDYIITLCNKADKECCNYNFDCEVICHKFDDPPRLAKEFKNETDIIDCYLKVSNQIKQYINDLSINIST
ncbi:UNVERIFIED_CONTAM: hypothetical protein GTU68_001791 [Idotea baltica]|nr:hypothetical protein [Idotea baltica]